MCVAECVCKREISNLFPILFNTPNTALHVLRSLERTPSPLTAHGLRLRVATRIRFVAHRLLNLARRQTGHCTVPQKHTMRVPEVPHVLVLDAASEVWLMYFTSPQSSTELPETTRVHARQSGFHIPRLSSFVPHSCVALYFDEWSAAVAEQRI